MKFLPNFSVLVMVYVGNFRKSTQKDAWQRGALRSDTYERAAIVSRGWEKGVGRLAEEQKWEKAQKLQKLDMTYMNKNPLPPPQHNQDTATVTSSTSRKKLRNNK